MTHGSSFSGIGGFDLAAEWVGWQNLFNCEIDPFCQTVLKHHFPDAEQFTDIRTADFAVYRGLIDVFTGGFPCFPADTMILTAKGYKPIQEVQIADRVLTKEGRFMPVNALMNKTVSDLVGIKAQGIVETLNATPNHPFWVKKRILPYARKYKDRFTPAQWVNAGEIEKGDLVAYRCIDGEKSSRTIAFWYLVGRFLGDGWVLDGKRKSRIPKGHRGSRINSRNWKVVICCNKLERSIVACNISNAGYRYTLSEDTTVDKFIISSKELTTFLSQFGRYAYGKELPGFVFSLNQKSKQALFNGWKDADGYSCANGSVKITTVSYKLAVGMAQLARDCFRCPVSVSKKTTNRQCVIEGRVVQERPQYCLTVSNNSRYGYYEDGFVWCLVKSVQQIKEQTKVYNIGVSEDETYTANGITVHNCQPFSTAGKQKGTEDDRYLWPEMLGVIRVVRPRWVVGENVYGIVSWSDGLVFEQVCADLEAEGYEVQPYVLPACGVGAPHQRYRTWFVAHRADAGIEDVRERKDEILSAGASADTTNKRCRERIGQGCQIRKRGVFQGEQTGCPLGSTVAGSDCERPAPHTDGRGLPERDAEPGGRKSYTATQRHCSIPRWKDFPTQSPVRRGDDGLSDWLDFDAVFEGIPTPRRIKKAYNRWREQAIKAYGNAVVPQVVLQIFETINEYETLSRAERSGK